MAHLARKAFYPAPPPFPLLHVDTRWKFQEMYLMRDQIAGMSGMELLVHVNPEAVAKDINPFDHGSALHTHITKTEGLKQALDLHGYDMVFGGARRDEEKSRAEERIFSFRSAAHRWDPKDQRPNCGTCSMPASGRAKASACSLCRTGPSSISGNTSIRKTFPWCPCTWHGSGRWWCATA